MKERPIIFTAESVRATLSGRKTQTRRVVKPTQSHPKVAPLHMYPYMFNGYQETDDNGLPCWVGEHPDYPGEGKWFSCPHGGVGDRLWVRETWATTISLDYEKPSDCHPGERNPMLWYQADPSTSAYAQSPNRGRWRAPLFMPRWASRITLTITDVRVERVQDMPWEDVKKEGIAAYTVARGVLSDNPPDPRWAYIELWDSLNAKRGYSWANNPWVWVISYEVNQ